MLPKIEDIKRRIPKFEFPENGMSPLEEININLRKKIKDTSDVKILI
jgi:hypothetical protein